MPLSIDLFCEMVANAATSSAQLGAFLNEHKLSVNERHSQTKLPPLAYILQSGDVNYAALDLILNQAPEELARDLGECCYPLMLAIQVKRDEIADWLLEYSKACIEKCRNDGNLQLQAQHYLDLGFYYGHKKEYSRSAKYYERAEENFRLFLCLKGWSLTVEGKKKIYRLIERMI